MKKFILCADDYGLSQPINEAILELIQLKRLQAVSCMVTSSNWPQAAQLLKPFVGKVKIGLHLNLTEGAPLTNLPKFYFGSLIRLLFLSHLRLLQSKKIIKEFEAQLNRFTKVMGRVPDFIDGHQYIHQFPVIRRALLEVYKRALTNVRPYIRVPANSFRKVLFDAVKSPKQLLIALTGAFSLRRVLNKLHIPYNKSFSGIYDFSTDIPYAKLFDQFIEEIDEGGLIVCHPSKPTDKATDKIYQARVREYQYLKGGNNINEIVL